MASKAPAELRQVHDRAVLDVDGFDAWLAARGWAWQGIDRGDYGLTLEEAQLIYVCEDPVLWCRAFMTEPDTGEPYSFFDYQEAAVRAWDQDLVCIAGAEVGKSRSIIATILWGQCTGFGFRIRNPSILVGAPQQTHLDEIIMAVEAHVGEGDGSSGRKPLINRFWRKPKRAPHTMHKFKGPTCTNDQLGLVYYRPASTDGEAFRGVHVNAMLLMDEAAKLKNPVCWSEFWRAGKPGCRKQVWSVPDGDNATVYYRLTQQARTNLQPGEDGWRLFHWPKTLMPPPFWTPERDREFQRLYGGRDAPGYQRNVLGLHGQQENPVWPWVLLESNIREVQEYRALKIVVDERNGTVQVQAFAFELVITEGKKSSRERALLDREDDFDAFKDSATRRDAVRSLLREVFDPIENAVLWFGADLGFSNDPTEILVSREIGHELRDIARINAKGVPYWMQTELVYCLDELFGFAGRFGVDFGSAGTKVVQDMQCLEIYEDGHYDERMTGFNFASVVDCVDEDGNALTEENKHGDQVPVRLPAKELATNLITDRFQKRAWAMPYDGEVINHLANHTAREGQKHRIFSKSMDHSIDARRVLILRKVFDEAVGAADVFSSGVYRREAA